MQLKLNIFIINIFFIFSFSLNAQSNKDINEIAKNIAYISAPSLYEVDYERLDISLREIIDKKLKQEKLIKAIQVIDILSKNKVFQAYKENGKVIYQKDIPDSINQHSKLTIDSFFDNEIVGKIVIFYDTKYKFKLTQKETQYLINKKEITMCIDPDWLPFEKIENGKHIGMTKDYYDIFQEKMGVPIKFIETKSWNETLEFAQKRKCDIISLAMETAERKKYMDFTDPYISSNLVIATRVDKTFSANIEEVISNKKLGIVKGYAFFEILIKKYPNNKIIEVDSLNAGLEMVHKGEIYGMIDSMITIGSKIQKKYPGVLAISSNFDQKWELGVAVRNDERILLEIFNKIIPVIGNNTKQAILNKWTSFTYKKDIDYTFAWQIIIVGLIVIFIILYWVRILKKEVQKRKMVEKELEILNNNLEKKVEIEVRLNRKKDLLLMEQSKMASMGEMIGNIAHQWRQPLSTISTASSGMQLQKEYNILTDKEFNESCEAINNNAQYLSKTIDDFKNFIKGDRKKTIFDFRNTIKGFLTLVNGSIKTHNINVIQDLQEYIIFDGYENELTQCLINIFNNSKDVLIEKEVKNKFLFISTFIDEEKIADENSNLRTKAIIKIKDNAGGIPEDILPKIFEPYFTTKHKSQGTGLGLHMTYNLIVDGMGGTIESSNITYEYEGKEYTGAEFKISLPLKS